MALIDMLQHLKALDPEENIKDGDGTLITLRSACTMALLGGEQRSLTEKEKVDRYILAQKISLCAKIELTADEIVLLKSAVGKSFGPLVVGRVFEIVDPPSMPKSDEDAPKKKSPLKSVKHHEAAQ